MVILNRNYMLFMVFLCWDLFPVRADNENILPGNDFFIGSCTVCLNMKKEFKMNFYNLNHLCLQNIWCDATLNCRFYCNFNRKSIL